MNIKETITQISKLREIKGKEKETRNLIDKILIEVINLKDWESVAILYWEKSLVAQHAAMIEYSKSKESQNKEIITESVKEMEKAAKEANKVVQKYNLEKLIGRSHRFLGNIYRYKKDFANAENEFIKALEEYQKYNNNYTLEIRGFIAYCLIQNGELENGLKLGIKTFEDFETSEKGINLKKSDYFTWAVWKSGIIPRMVEALMETKATFDKNIIEKYLEESERILKMPEGKITWDENAFQLRLDEIYKAKDILKNL